MKLKPAFWILGGIMFILLILSIVYGAPVPIEQYKGVNLKFYDENTNKSKYYDAIDKINPVFFENVRAVIVYPYHSWACGFYYSSTRVIYLFGSCNGPTHKVLSHELAHHMGFREHDRAFKRMKDIIEQTEG